MDIIYNYSDEHLKKLIEKQNEKQTRYNLMYNEATIRTERIMLNIHLEQVRRWRERNVSAFREAMNATS